MDYREYQEGDTVRVTGCQGRLFCSHGRRRFNSGVPLGVECVLVRGEDDDLDVKLPIGILADDDIYISVACIELVKAVEDKTSAIEHIDIGSNNQLFNVRDHVAQQLVAQVWYDANRLPKEVAKAFAEAIKAVYDSIVIDRKTNS